MNQFLSRSLLLTLCMAAVLSHAQTPESPATPKINIIQSTDKTIEKTVYFDQEGTQIKKPKTNTEGFYRKFLGQTTEGGYVVQDFYQKNDLKQSDPFILTDKNELKLWEVNSIEGEHTLWYENGQKIVNIHFTNQQREGRATWWYENGNKQTEEYYKNGVLDGLSTCWYRNGQKSSESHVENGKLEGTSTEWYENGQKSLEEYYKNDLKEGPFTAWSTNGEKAVEAHYKNGQKDGLWTFWHPDGVVQKIRYQNNEVVDEN